MPVAPRSAPGENDQEFHDPEPTKSTTEIVKDVPAKTVMVPTK